jgi:acetyl esterase/lipase
MAPANFLYSNPATSDKQNFISYIYEFLLGRNYRDDPAGVDYWVSLLATQSPGTIISSMYNSLSQQTGNDHLQSSNRINMLEASIRAQKYWQAHGHPSYSLLSEDSLGLVRRVGYNTNTRNNAANDLWNVIANARQPSSGQTPKWQDPSVSPSFISDSSYLYQRVWYQDVNGVNTVYNGSPTVRSHEGLGWTNSSGDSMYANVYLPPSYTSSSANLPAVVWVHGGGWREWFPELSNIEAEAIANAGYVVFTPNYRLSVYGYSSPTQQNDINDFVTLLKSTASNLGIDPNRIGLGGQSSGGHLALLNTLTQSNTFKCVAVQYPPTDLYLDPIVGGDNKEIDYIAKYVGSTTPANEQAVSPYYKVKSVSGTKFLIQQGSADTLVPQTETDSFSSKMAGYPYYNQITEAVLSGEGHGFSDPGIQSTNKQVTDFFGSGNPSTNTPGCNL